jgi:hypothetical protein
MLRETTMTIVKKARKKRKRKNTKKAKVEKRTRKKVSFSFIYHRITHPTIIVIYPLSHPINQSHLTMTSSAPAPKKRKTAHDNKVKEQEDDGEGEDDEDGAGEEYDEDDDEGTNDTADKSGPAQAAKKEKGGDVPKEDDLSEVEAED